MYLPDPNALDGFIKTLNAAGCIAICDATSRTLELDIPDTKWKHKEHIVNEEEDI